MKISVVILIGLLLSTCSAAASRFGFGSLEIRLNADSHNTPACALSRRYAPRYGCAIEFGKQQFIASKGIGFLVVGFHFGHPSASVAAQSSERVLRKASFRASL